MSSLLRVLARRAPRREERDCRSCALFRKCGQYAVTLPLRSDARIRPEQPAAVIYGGRAVAGRRANIERMHLGTSTEQGTRRAVYALEEIPA